MQGNQSFFRRHDQLINRIVDYRFRNTFPEKEMKFIVDDNRTLKSLEERINQLTVGMENMRKTLDRFVTLYESEKSQPLAERQEVEKLIKSAAAAENREKDLEIKVVGMRMQMEMLRNNWNWDKLQWEQERDQMQNELEYYKSLSQKGPTDSSSAQTTGLFNAVSKQNHDKGWERNPDNAGTTVKTQFAQRTNNAQPNMRDYPVVALRRKDKCTTIKKAIIQKYAESQQSQENAEPEERFQQKSEQKVPEPVVAQSERVIEPSPIAPRAVPESSAPMSSPTAHPTENHSNPNARRLLMSLLEEHYCGNSECCVLEFLNCMKHATKCAIGSQCKWFICMCVHGRAEHLKVCVQSQCARTSCQRPMIVNEDKIRDIVTMLKKYCFVNSVGSENESARKAVIYMAVRAAVNYGLVDSGEKMHTEDTADGESSSSSPDEEESSEGEKTSEEWEMFEIPTVELSKK